MNGPPYTNRQMYQSAQTVQQFGQMANSPFQQGNASPSPQQMYAYSQMNRYQQVPQQYLVHSNQLQYAGVQTAYPVGLGQQSFATGYVVPQYGAGTQAYPSQSPSAIYAAQASQPYATLGPSPASFGGPSNSSTPYQSFSTGANQPQSSAFGQALAPVSPTVQTHNMNAATCSSTAFNSPRNANASVHNPIGDQRHSASAAHTMAPQSEFEASFTWKSNPSEFPPPRQFIGGTKIYPSQRAQQSVANRGAMRRMPVSQQ